jgi:hypothetical protein
MTAVLDRIPRTSYEANRMMIEHDSRPRTLKGRMPLDGQTALWRDSLAGTVRLTYRARTGINRSSRNRALVQYDSDGSVHLFSNVLSRAAQRRVERALPPGWHMEPWRTYNEPTVVYGEGTDPAWTVDTAIVFRPDGSFVRHYITTTREELEAMRADFETQPEPTPRRRPRRRRPARPSYSTPRAVPAPLSEEEMAEAHAAYERALDAATAPVTPDPRHYTWSEVTLDAEGDRRVTPFSWADADRNPMPTLPEQIVVPPIRGERTSLRGMNEAARLAGEQIIEQRRVERDADNLYRYTVETLNEASERIAEPYRRRFDALTLEA